jgi:S1-C subfamily serine protease
MRPSLLPWPVRLVLSSLAVALAVALAGCGGGGGGGGGGQRTASAPAAPRGAVPLQQQFVRTVDAVAPRVVLIDTGRALGSGVVFDDRGDIVTNAHVVGDARRMTVVAPDGHRYPATLVGAFPPDDLAVVRAKGANLKPVAFGDSSKLQVGDIVLAVGNPLGLRSSVTDGIVSALGRTVNEPTGATLPQVIQTSAPINPGNSGGALVDLDAKVVGIPTLAAVDPELGGTASGIGFAIPSNVVKDIAGQIVEHGRVVDANRAFLGVQLAAGYGAPGPVVAAVQPGGPADKAGVRRGEAIVSVNGRRTPTPQAVGDVLATLKPGQQAKVALADPDGGRRTVTVTLGDLAQAGRQG